ncbi:MAG: hypothetical protein LBK58_00760 [Prevotellaceae bacterium]|jgi:hypothetical protein|nr:hypothetical protein [Prevotellaceae bacterium]
MNSAKIEKRKEKIDFLFEEFKNRITNKYLHIGEDTDSYEFEKKMREEFCYFEHDIYQTVCGEEYVPKMTEWNC